MGPMPVDQAQPLAVPRPKSFTTSLPEENAQSARWEHLIRPSGKLEITVWIRLTRRMFFDRCCPKREAMPMERCAETLVDLDVAAEIETGWRTTLGSTLTRTSTVSDNGTGVPALIECLPMLSESRDEPTIHTGHGFVEAVAAARKTGLPVFFTGEARKRIALPGDSFQRCRQWLSKHDQ